ncbi:hypothetical protein QL285_063944 [Trifolium repens]|nr:hypothetical protein QL285_063944 [Trifolium repens]
MSGNKRKRKDNPTSLSELDPVALINRPNQSVDIQEPGSTPSALESVTFRPATFQAPAYQPTTLQPYAQEFGFTPPALQNIWAPATTITTAAATPTILATPINATTILDTTNHATRILATTNHTTTILDTTIYTTTIHPTTIHTRSRRGTISHVHQSRRKYNSEVKYSSKKLLIYPGGKGLEPCTDVAFFITKAIKTVYKIFNPTFAELIKVEGVKEEMFEVLSKHGTWEAHHHEDVENNFYYVAGLRLKDMLFDIKEKGPNVDISDIHKETHIKKSIGGYVDTRSETTQRLYDDKIEKFLDKHPEYSSHDAIPGTIRRDIWQEVSGPGTKNTKYGFGKLALNIRHENLVHIPTPEERCRPVALPTAAQVEIERLTRELQAQKEELNRRDQQDQERHEMMQQEIRRVREEQRRAMDQQRREMDQQRREMGVYIRELLASSSRNAPIDETNSQEDSTNSNNEDMGAN